jgi:6-phosphofructokinase 1
MRLGILTSGGDSPGMNAAVRAAVRGGTDIGLELVGIMHGYEGLIEGDMMPLDNRAVGGILERGGTFLGSARSKEFRVESGQRKALASIERAGLDGLIVIGGNGSLAGARWLQESGVPTVGIPASIDNDVYGTAMAIGVDTALNTVVESLDRIRDTAISHDRAFVVEVMGRSSGYIALMGGLAGGAEVVLVPEFPESLDQIEASVVEGVKKGKHHSIIVVAEGFSPADSPQTEKAAGRIVSDFLAAKGTLETRLTILGHLQRGGSPSAFDRIIACRLGEAAVRVLAQGDSGVMVALSGRDVSTVSLSDIDRPSTNFNPDIYKLINKIAN